jgi:uncharacterized repeat protein (TIGR03847 family)
MLLEIEELVEEDETAPQEQLGEQPEEPIEAAAPAEEGLEPARFRLWATREQMLALARHGATVAARGRPKCRYCGNPIDPQGHMCPAMNGHRETAGR